MSARPLPISTGTAPKPRYASAHAALRAAVPALAALISAAQDRKRASDREAAA